MAKKTRATILTEIQDGLPTAPADVWTEARCSEALNKALKEMGRYDPVIVRHTLSTTEDVKTLDINSVTNKLYIPQNMGLEYKVDKTPKKYRNWRYITHDVILMAVDFNPGDADSVYLYVHKPHRMTLTTTLAGKIDLEAGYAVGVTTLHLDDFANAAAIPADTTLIITGDTTRYRITADVTVSDDDDSEADFAIDPALVVAVIDNVVVTLETSTLSFELEDILIKLTQGRLAMDLMVHYVEQPTFGGKEQATKYYNWGAAKVQEALSKLRPYRVADRYDFVPWPRTE